MSKLTPKQFTVARFPDAHAVKQADGMWAVYPDKDTPRFPPIAYGATPNKAWEAAALYAAEVIRNDEWGATDTPKPATVKRGDRVTFVEDGVTKTGKVHDLAGTEAVIHVDGEPGDSFIPLSWIVTPEPSAVPPVKVARVSRKVKQARRTKGKQARASRKRNRAA